MDRTLKFRHQRRADDTLESFDSWILLTVLPSRDMAKSVSQEAYERASLPEPQAHVINHLLLILQFVIEHVLFLQRVKLVRFCVSERHEFTVGELSHLPKSLSKPLCKACPGCGGMVQVCCSCGHVFVDKHLLTPSRKHTLRSFRAIKTVKKAVDQLTKSLA